MTRKRQLFFTSARSPSSDNLHRKGAEDAWIRREIFYRLLSQLTTTVEMQASHCRMDFLGLTSLITNTPYAGCQ